MARQTAVKIEGVQEARAAIFKLKEGVDAQMRLFLHEGGLIVQKNIRRQFHPRPAGSRRVSQRTGRIYYTGPGNPDHRPTSRSGNLRNSIHRTDVHRIPGGYRVEIGPTTIYGRAIELGYPPHNLAPYPYTEPGLKASQGELDQSYEAHMALAMRVG